MKKGVIDRFEGEYTVVEFDGQIEEILRSQLPEDAKIGDTFVFDKNRITVDKIDTETRK